MRAGERTGGSATILLHGAAGSWTTWTPLLTASALDGAPLSDVIAVDLPGWGESCGLDRVHSVADISDSVAMIAHALGYEDWRLVGHSLGGFVALDIAARHPERTLAVTLVSPTGRSVVDAIRRPFRGGAALPGFAGMLLAMRTLALLPDDGRRLLHFFSRRGWMPALTAPLFTTRVHPSVVVAFSDEVRPSAFAAAARLADAYDLRAWSTIRCPVRAVRGARDVFAGPADAAAFIALVPGFHETRLRDAGHFAHIERPDAVLDAVSAVAGVGRDATAAA